jgi:pimeloyl-ACP methyl ester carboxylesterase
MNKTLKIFFMCFSFVLLLVGCGKKGEEPVDIAVEKAEPTISIDNAISADGVSIVYEVRGEGEPALVFIHGWCCDRSYWSEQLPHFAEKYKVVAIDLAGHGESGLDRKEWTIEAFGDDVVAVVDKLNLEQVVLIGHSMGGFVMLEVGREIPQRILGLVGTDTIWDFESKYPQEFVDAVLKGLNDNFVEFMKDFVRDMFIENSDPLLIDKIVRSTSSIPPEVGIGAVKAVINFQNNEIIQVLSEVKAPITCINADATNVETNKRYVPSFKAKIMSGVGHFNMMEAPDEFNRLLEETIQEFVQMAESK